MEIVPVTYRDSYILGQLSDFLCMIGLTSNFKTKYNSHGFVMTILTSILIVLFQKFEFDFHSHPIILVTYLVSN